MAGSSGLNEVQQQCLHISLILAEPLRLRVSALNDSSFNFSILNFSRRHRGSDPDVERTQQGDEHRHDEINKVLNLHSVNSFKFQVKTTF